MLGTVLALKLVVLLCGTASHVTSWGGGGVGSIAGLLAIWNHWDSLNYQYLAQFGYEPSGSKAHLIAFFPLYPGLIRMLARILGDHLLSAFAISTLASFAVGLLLHRLVRLDAPQDADRAVWFLFAFPTAFTLHIGYTESLFLALALGCILAARRQRLDIAGLLGLCAGLTRINGLVLMAALACEAFGQRRAGARSRWIWLAPAMPALGFAVYLLINAVVAGDPFAFLRHQAGHFQRAADWPWNGLLHTWQVLLRPQPDEVFAMRVQEFVFGCIAVAGSCAALRWQRPSYAAWTVLNTLMFLSFSMPWSVPRYALLLFPLHVAFARLGRSPLWFAAVTAWSLFYLVQFAGLFARGAWAF